MFSTYLASSSVVQYIGEKQVHLGLTPQEVKNDRPSLGTRVVKLYIRETMLTYQKS